jgi:hypothetical protein
MLTMFDKFVPAIFQGNVMKDYYVCPESQSIWSCKNGRWWRVSIPTSGKSLYPQMVFRIDGENTSAKIHKVIAETLLPFPRPAGVSKKEWDATPETVKRLVKSMYLVNHIDHDKYNCSLDNLEWVTFIGNARAYQKHVSEVV